MLKLPDTLTIKFIKSLKNTDIIHNYSFDDRIKMVEFLGDQIEKDESLTIFDVYETMKIFFTKEELKVESTDEDVEILFCDDPIKRAKMLNETNFSSIVGLTYAENDNKVFEEICKILLEEINNKDKEKLDKIIKTSRNFEELIKNVDENINNFTIEGMIFFRKKNVFIQDLLLITDEENRYKVFVDEIQNKPTIIPDELLFSFSNEKILDLLKIDSETFKIYLGLIINKIMDRFNDDNQLEKLFEFFSDKHESYKIILKIKDEAHRYKLFEKHYDNIGYNAKEIIESFKEEKYIIKCIELYKPIFMYSDHIFLVGILRKINNPEKQKEIISNSDFLKHNLFYIINNLFDNDEDKYDILKENIKLFSIYYPGEIISSFSIEYYSKVLKLLEKNNDIFKIDNELKNRVMEAVKNDDNLFVDFALDHFDFEPISNELEQDKKKFDLFYNKIIELLPVEDRKLYEEEVNKITGYTLAGLTLAGTNIIDKYSIEGIKVLGNIFGLIKNLRWISDLSKLDGVLSLLTNKEKENVLIEIILQNHRISDEEKSNLIKKYVSDIMLLDSRIGSMYNYEVKRKLIISYASEYKKLPFEIKRKSFCNNRDCLNDDDMILIYGENFSYIFNKYNDIFFQNYVTELFKGEDVEELTKEEIDTSIHLIMRITCSNSVEIIRLKDELIKALKIYDIKTADNKLDTIEKVFLRNNLPYGAKLFAVYNTLHPTFLGLRVSSKVLMNQDLSKEQKDYVLLMDSIKICMYSGPENILDYLMHFKNLSNGISQLLDAKNENIGFAELFNSKYASSIENLLDLSKSWSFLFDSEDNISYEELYNNLNSDLINGMYDYVISIFNESTGMNFKNVDEIIQHIKDNNELVNERNISRAKNNDFELEKGDLVKGIMNSDKYLCSMLNTGVNCKEFLGGNASGDYTNLDTDFSMITKEEGNISEKLDSTTAGGFSDNVWVVLKNSNERFNADGNINDRRMEIFSIGGENYGIRTGVATSDIDFLICKKWNERIGLAIALSGIYIPVITTDKKLVFTPEMYGELRTKMSGLSFYGVSEVPNISDRCFSNGFDDLKDMITNDKENTISSFEQVAELLSSIISKYTGNVYTSIMPLDLKGAELIDTGSTARNNNMPKDYDFDFMCRLDNEIYSTNKKDELVNNIEKELKNLGGRPNVGNRPPERIRYDNVLIDGVPTPIDISFIQRTNRVEYTTDIALKDKMNSIEKAHGTDVADYVRANILVAKKIFKNSECYKKPNGITGVGVENFILQSNGSLFDAMDNYINEYEKHDNPMEFINNFSVFDFGMNFYDNYSDGHDNFIGMLGISGVKKAYEAFKQFKIAYERAEDKTEFINNYLFDGDEIEKSRII